MRVSHIVFALSLGVCGAWANGVKGHCYQHFKNTDIFVSSQRKNSNAKSLKKAAMYMGLGDCLM